MKWKNGIKIFHCCKRTWRIKRGDSLVPYSGNRALAEGAFFAAITVVLGLLGLYLPPLLFLTSLLMPVPLAVLVRRRDLRLGLMALAVAAGLMFILFGRPLTVLLLLIKSGPMGLLLGLLFKNRVSAGPGISAASVLAALTTVLTFLITFWITGINPFAMGEEIRHSMGQVMEWYSKSGLLDQKTLAEIKTTLEDTAKIFVMLLPANLVIWSIISACITYAAARVFLFKLHFEVTPLPPFSHWRLPWFVIWGGIAGLSLTLLDDYIALKGLSVVGINILFVMGFVHVALGVSVFTFFVKKWHVAGWIKFLVIILVTLYWPAALSVTLTLGVLDPIMDVRRLVNHGDTTKGG
jgi:uncharacterized protein YybS (DUF2232 family)